MGKTCVLTDIHGRLTELERLLKLLPTDAKLVFLGDYIDRGSQSAEVVTLVKSLPNAVCLRGNHEDMILDPHTMGGTWIANGGKATLESYREPLSGALKRDLLKEHIDWFRGLPRVHSDAHRVYVHAGVDPSHPLDSQPETITQWFRYPSGADIGYHGRHVVHGHTPGIVLLTQRTCLDGGKQMTCGVFDDDKPGGPEELLWV